MHALLGLRNGTEVLSHPRFGASWEGFALEQVIRFLEADRDAYFWATHGGAELDLLFVYRGRRYGVEVKFSEAPVLTASMRVALHDLRLEHLWVVYPGDSRHPIDARVTAWPLREVPALRAQLARR